MNAYMECHECVRQMQVSLEDFDVSGDVSWPQRSILDIALRMVRSVMRTYSEVSHERAMELAKVCWWEAVRRILSFFKDDAKMTRKVRLVLDLMRASQVE